MEITVRRGIPVTCPAQTLVDVATELAPRALERVVNEADKLDLIHPEEIRKAISERYAGEPGIALTEAAGSPYVLPLGL